MALIHIVMFQFKADVNSEAVQKVSRSSLDTDTCY